MLKSHNENYHKMNELQCPHGECGKKERSINILQGHVRSQHPPEFLVTCRPDCGRENKLSGLCWVRKDSVEELSVTNGKRSSSRKKIRLTTEVTHLNT